MSDYDDGDEFEADGSSEPREPESTRKNDWRRKLEREAEDGRRAAEEAKAAKRELAFLRAGIDPSNLTPQQKLFVKAYDGDLTADAVRAAAQEYGVVEAPQEQVPAEELAGHDRFAQASAGSSVTPPDGDVYLNQIESAESEADVLAALAKINPEMIDTKSRMTKWAMGGGKDTAVTTPIQ